MRKTSLNGWGMAAPFSYKQAQEITALFNRHKVSYLFIGKSGAIILGFPDTTQDVDIFADKSPENGKRIVKSLLELGFHINEKQQDEIKRGKDFVQLRNGPFDLDLVFSPDGIENFAEAKSRSLTVEGMPVCHLDDIIQSKKSANRVKDREVIARLEAFREWRCKQDRI